MGPHDANKAIVREFLEVFSTGDVAAILARMHDSGSWWVSGSIDGISGTYNKQEFGKLLEGVTGVYKTGALRMTPSSMIAEGDKVAAEAESYGELNNGRVYRCRYHLLFEIADGRVKHVKEYMDTHHLYEIFVAE